MHNVFKIMQSVAHELGRTRCFLWLEVVHSVRATKCASLKIYVYMYVCVRTVHAYALNRKTGILSHSIRKVYVSF